MAIVNTVNATGVSDLILTLVVLSFLVLGSFGGLFKSSRLAGLTALSILGGMSVGMRIVLFREGLLLHTISLNWIIIVVLAVAGSVVTLLRQQIGIVRVFPRNPSLRQYLTGCLQRPFLARSQERSSWHLGSISL